MVKQDLAQESEEKALSAQEGESVQGASGEAQEAVEASAAEGDQSEGSGLEVEEVTEEEEAMDMRLVIIRTVVAVLMVVIFLVVAGYLLREPLTRISVVFVRLLGGFGVAAGFFLIDGFTVPFPNDALTFFGLQGGLPFWSVVAWASGGSLIGGSAGYLIGVRLHQTAWFKAFMRGRGAEAYALAHRYGLWAVGIGAFTPVPYSLSSWAAGAVEVRFSHFLLVSLLRIPRIALYLWLIQIGFVKFG